MTLLRGRSAEGGIDFLIPDVNIANRGSTATTPGTLGAPAAYPGGNGDAGELTPVPNLYFAAPLSRELWFGFAVTAPFGLSLEYSRDWFGRYDSIKSKLLTLDLAPSLAWRLSEFVSIGGGINMQYADAELTNALPNTVNPGGPTPATDGFARLTGDGWATGFNVGVLYAPSLQTRIGAHYRSGIKHELDGDASIEDLSGPLATANGRFGARTEFKLPPIASLALAQRIASDWTLLAELQWFGWSDFDEVRTRLAGGLPDAVRVQRFRDTRSFALGLEFRASAQWSLRGGARVENSPTVDEFRNTSIPDSDLTWLGLGASYHVSDRLALDFGYLRAIFKQVDINLNLNFFEGTPAAGSVNVLGRTDNIVNTFSFSLRYRL